MTPDLEPVPYMASPWPNPKRYAVTRRLFAYWRWLGEGHMEGARNARSSVERRAPEVFR